MKKNILAISGSTRKNSSNEFILRVIKDVYKDILEVELFSSLEALPHFVPDMDDALIPLPVLAFREKVYKADGIIICSPEYVFSIPAVLKNALEWCISTTIFMQKPVAVIIASGLGEKACEQLNLILKTMQSDIDKNSSIILQGARGKINSEGKIMDAEMMKKIDSLIQSFISILEKNQENNWCSRNEYGSIEK